MANPLWGHRSRPSVGSAKGLNRLADTRAAVGRALELRINAPGYASDAADHHVSIADLERFVNEINELILQKADDAPLVGELRSRKARLGDEIEWLRHKPSQQACHH